MKLYITTIATFAAALLPVRVSAAPHTTVAACASDPWSNIFGFQPWYACLPGGSAGEPRLTSINDVFLVIFPLVDSLVKVGALVAAGIMFYMIINMITARGDAGKIKTSVEGMRDAVIGLIICLVSVAIVNFIASAFQTS